MNSVPRTPRGLRHVAPSPVKGLAVAERRVEDPVASLICVHGGLDRGGSFARLARRLGQFDVVTYDRRGYQGSRELAPLDFDHHVSDLLALVEHEAARLPVILFGHSYGGTVAFAGAVADPAAIHLAVAYESPFPQVLARPGVPVPNLDDPQDEAERFFRRMVSSTTWERLSEPQRRSRRLDGPALVADLASLHDASATVDLARLQTPSLYLFGDGGHLGFYRELASELARRNPVIHTRMIQGANHDAHLAASDALAATIQEQWRAVCALA